MSPARRLSFDLFVDSSGFYALSNVNDPYHGAAAALIVAGAADRLRLCTTNFVLAETHALFLSRRGRTTAFDFVQRVLGGATVVERVTPADEAAALAILERYVDKDFSYTDATSFAVMARLNLRVALTSDRHFSQFGYIRAGA